MERHAEGCKCKKGRRDLRCIEATGLTRSRSERELVTMLARNGFHEVKEKVGNA